MEIIAQYFKKLRFIKCVLTWTMVPTIDVWGGGAEGAAAPSLKIFRANSVFQGKRILLKNPERWKIFQYSVYSLGGDPCTLDQSSIRDRRF